MGVTDKPPIKSILYAFSGNQLAALVGNAKRRSQDLGQQQFPHLRYARLAKEYNANSSTIETVADTLLPAFALPVMTISAIK